MLGWLKGAVLVALICWLFPGKPHPPRDLAPLPPMSRDEKRLAWLLAVVLSLWVTESWHGVGPAWTGLAAAVDHAAAAGGLYQRRGVLPAG
ncbi:di- and tricarboxylate transporter [Klebsiella pneumoniae]|uniref:Di- and tricarboxylate transporter n=1 Tax=Klebsiella pneumoniae TaxID=573 RepID=A0A447RUY4_KLEPN|nr:di- and tricarboxylate transporter [Klebsiella pneumoniae]